MADEAAEGSAATPVPQPMNKSISIDTSSIQVIASKNYANMRESIRENSNKIP